MSNAILYRMPSGIPGDVSRKSQSTIESHHVGGQFAAFGLFGKLSATTGDFVPLESTDTAAAVYGLLVRAYPTQSAQNELGKAVPTASDIQDALVRGYMTVKCNAGTAKKAGKVYVRVAAGTTAKPIGGIEAVADSTNTIEITKAMFMHDADAQGNVEIAFNI
ncbi:structural cement protein Gp24 [Acinetobacter soli]|uniref:structural cement protein Gp24 n=1 Tax=Acinetobacter soli TaxID=487316 RepID=UPI002FF384EE